jgi:ABC-type nitrate/sulfonate/bicarbonate transport system ATPase subunit
MVFLAGMPAHVKLDGVRHAHGGDEVLGRVDLEIGAGELVAVAGPPGSGKSTLHALLAGLVRPAAGAVRVDGARVRGPADAVRGVAFQQPGFAPWLCVRDNVALALRLRGVPAGVGGAAADAALARLGLEHVAGEYPVALSPAERRGCSIARALAGEPPLVLLDAPFAGLGAAARSAVCDTLRHRTTVVLTTRDANEAEALGARVVLLEAGRSSTSTAIAAAPHGRR